MSRYHAHSQPPLSKQPIPLYKQRSWSPDTVREEAWLRRKEVHDRGLRRIQSLMDDDLEELKGCIELGFGFEPDSTELDPRLSETLPALPFYYAVNRHYNGRISRSSSESSLNSYCSDDSSTPSIIEQGDDPETAKTRLRQWAQVVACSVRQLQGVPKWITSFIWISRFIACFSSLYYKYKAFIFYIMAAAKSSDPLLESAANILVEHFGAVPRKREEAQD